VFVTPWILHRYSMDSVWIVYGMMIYNSCEIKSENQASIRVKLKIELNPNAFITIGHLSIHP